MSKEILYIFIDEAGNFDFSPKGSKYYIIGALSKRRPFEACNELVQLKYDLIEAGAEIEYFHATEDKQKTRDGVFEIIRNNINGCKFIASIVSKNKTNPTLRPPEKFYATLLAFNIKQTLKNEDLSSVKEVIIFTDSIPSKHQLLKKAIKPKLAEILAPFEVPYRIYHHASKSNLDLQIADYFTWAVQRKWERADDRSYQKIENAICLESDLFATEETYY